MHRYYNIQVLRAVAATAVLLFHASEKTHERIPGPSLIYDLFTDRFALGVPLFFAISGFVLSHAIQRESIPRFVASRVLRIYPAYWLAIGLSLVAFALLPGVSPSTAVSWSALTLLPRGPQPTPLGGIEWTLVYEMFFYALFALVWLARSERAVLAFCVGWLALILASSALAPGRYTVSAPDGLRIALSAYNLPFIFGMLAYLAHGRIARKYLPLLALGFVALAVATEYVRYLKELQYVVVGLACGLLLIVVGALARKRDLAARNPLVRIGDYSYGLYLVHFNAVVAIVGLVDPARFSAATLFAVAFAGAFAIGCAFGLIESRLYAYARRRLLGVRAPRDSAAGEPMRARSQRGIPGE